MNTACWKVFAGLWPTAMKYWGDETVGEFNRRVRELSLSEQQVVAVLRQYRFEVNAQVPKPVDLLARLRFAANIASRSGPMASPGSSDYAPTPLSGEPISLREFCRRKAALGEPVYPMPLAVAGRTPEEADRRRKIRDEARLRELRSGL